MRLSHINNIETVGNVYFVHFALFGFLLNNILVQKNFYAQDITNSKKDICENMQVINSSSCRHRFKKLEILITPSLYIYSLILFAVDNLHYFQTNSSVHDINTSITNNYTYLQLDFLVYKSTNYSAIRIFN
jgi:hypothetical protein